MLYVWNLVLGKGWGEKGEIRPSRLWNGGAETFWQMSLLNTSAVYLRNPLCGAWNFSYMGPNRAVQGIYLLCTELCYNLLLLLLLVLLAENDIIFIGGSLVESLMPEVHLRWRTSDSYTSSAVDFCSMFICFFSSSPRTVNHFIIFSLLHKQTTLRIMMARYPTLKGT